MKTTRTMKTNQFSLQHIAVKCLRKGKEGILPVYSKVESAWFSWFRWFKLSARTESKTKLGHTLTRATGLGETV